MLLKMLSTTNSLSLSPPPSFPLQIKFKSCQSILFICWNMHQPTTTTSTFAFSFILTFVFVLQKLKAQFMLFILAFVFVRVRPKSLKKIQKVLFFYCEREILLILARERFSFNCYKFFFIIICSLIWIV